MSTKHRFALGTRWTARVWSFASLAFIAVLMIGNLQAAGGLQMTARESALFLFFPIGVVAGLLIAWWKEMIGGATAVASLVGFYALHAIIAGGLPGGVYFVLLALPGLLFVVAALTDDTHQPAHHS